MQPEIPIFGKKQSDKVYKTRLGAYIIIVNPEKEEMVLVSPPNGAYFLPGGEIEGAETKEETIHRECMEELGYAVSIGSYLGQANEYFYSSFRDTYFYNPGYFYVATSWVKKSEPLETCNTLEWYPYEEALLRLKRGSHRFAVASFIKSIEKPKKNER